MERNWPRRKATYAVSLKAEWKGYSSPWEFHPKFAVLDVKSQSLVFVMLIFSFALVRYFTTPLGMRRFTLCFCIREIYNLFLMLWGFAVKRLVESEETPHLHF